MDDLLGVVGIGRMTRISDDDPVQRLQVTEPAQGKGGYDRVTDETPRATEYGFSSVPPADSEVIVLRRNGRRSVSIVIATSHRDSRPTGLSEGDVVIYDVNGHKITLSEDGITIDAAGDQVTVTNASKVRCECDIETTGDIISRADGEKVSLNKLHDAYNEHDHPPVTLGTSWGSGPPDVLAGPPDEDA